LKDSKAVLLLYKNLEGDWVYRQNLTCEKLLRFAHTRAGHAEKSLHTQLAVDTREVFLDYRHNSSEATDVTFNLKDFKAVLVLCEGLGTNVAICFDQPGSPLLVQPVFHSSNPLVHGRLTIRQHVLENICADAV